MADNPLMKDLYRLPNVIGSLGLSLAEAQKQFNLEYLNSIEVLVSQVRSLLGKSKEGADGAFLKELLLTLAPPRYQFTQTELTVKLDLSQSMDAAKSAGLGFGMGALVVNASYASGFSQDYRAAAEIKTVIHAMLPTGENRHLFESLLSNAAKFSEDSLTLPPTSELNTRIVDSVDGIAKKAGFDAAEIKKTVAKPDK